MQLFLLTFTALISVVNPLGTLPIFVGLTKDKAPKEIQRTAIWTSINMFIILIISFFLGKYVLEFFGISLSSLKIAGGLIIASSGFALLTGNFTKHKGMKKREKDEAFSKSDVSLTPLAIPMLAGPGTISLLISFQSEHPAFWEKMTIISAIITVSVVVCILLLGSKVIVKSLGATGIQALSRIIGFIVIAIGIEYIRSTVVSEISLLFS